MNARDPAPQIPPCAAVAFEIPSNRKSRVGDHPSEVALTGEAPNRFHEVLVRLAVARKDRA